jgi:aminoglycoside phosphotransferase (APT) family kinase protein
VSQPAGGAPATTEVVDTPAQAEGLPLAPLVVRRPLEAWLDAAGLGAGPVRATRIGEGHSNVTFLVEREGLRGVLRRPPRPPLPPSAHDVLREARLLRALAPTAVRVPEVLATCEDEAVLGVPFYVMRELEGAVLTDALPPALDEPAGRARIAEELVDALVEVHAADWRACGLEGFGKPAGYLERQVRRFAGLWEVNKTREVPLVGELATRLAARVPEQREATIVHGDYRLGNVMFASGAPARLVAIFDWELATIGDPLADLGYLVATWSDRDGPQTVIGLSPVTRREGFPGRDGLAELYAARSGRDLGDLGWYRALALWKSAVFCEAIYGRYLRGETSAPFAAALGDGIPALAEAAAAALRA